MSESAYVDPLEVAEELCEAILGSTKKRGDIERIACLLDKFIYSLHWVFQSDVQPIQETDRKPPSFAYEELHRILRERFTGIGLYWRALDSNCDKNGELVTGDAIDDLADIVIELKDALWFRDNVNRDDAMAALQFAYRRHLWDHMLPLRFYLEELIFNE